ncbi:hypothetical protein ACQPZF_24110 [Actinosynnema sp. CS-041913]|uniref:hypothetical protein n=1 Tax=Actinosynnema sp. CS-041913 TaxID=3239917 RepID=UPI003D9102D6
MNKNVGRVVSAVFAGAALTTATAPAAIAAPIGAHAENPVRHPSEEAAALRDQGIAVREAADQLKAAAEAATTPAEAQAVLDAAPGLKALAEQVDEDAQAYLNRDIPGQTHDDRIAVAQGIHHAGTAITTADEAVAIATPKAVVTPDPTNPDPTSPDPTSPEPTTPAPTTPVPTTEPSTPAPTTPAAGAAQPQVKVKPKGGVATGGGATART